MNAARAGLVYAVVVFGLGFGFGVVRTLWVAPQIGAFAAVAIEVPLILLLAWRLCRWALDRCDVGAAHRDRALMAAVAFACTMAAEATGARLIGGLSIAAWLSGFGTPARLVGLVGQLAFVAFPLFVRRQVDTAHRAR